MSSPSKRHPRQRAASDARARRIEAGVAGRRTSAGTTTPHQPARSARPRGAASRQAARAHQTKRRAVIGVAVAALAALLAYGASSALSTGHGTHSQAGTATLGGVSPTYGQPLAATTPLTLAAALASAKAAPHTPVTLVAQVVGQGPTMGCWFELHQPGQPTFLAQTNPMDYMPQMDGARVEVTGYLVHGLSYGPYPGMGYTGSPDVWVLATPGVRVLAGPKA